MFQGDIHAWEKWNKLLIRQLKQIEARWQLPGPSADISTSLSLLALALNYRFLPIYERRPELHIRPENDTSTMNPGWCVMRAWLLLVPLARLFAPTMAGAAPPVDPPSAVLHLSNGGCVPGELIASSRPDLIRWQSTAFTAPFDLPRKAVTAVHFSVPARAARGYW